MMIRMPAINVKDQDRDYLEQLRRKYPSPQIPDRNELMHRIILYIKVREVEFLEQQKKEHKSE